MLDADVLVDARLVEHLITDRAFGVERTLLVLGQEPDLVAHPNVPRQTGSMDKHLSAIVALLGLFVVLAFLVPVQISLSLEHFAAVTK